MSNRQQYMQHVRLSDILLEKWLEARNYEDSAKTFT
jgi:hypothetical protein